MLLQEGRAAARAASSDSPDSCLSVVNRLLLGSPAESVSSGSRPENLRSAPWCSWVFRSHRFWLLLSAYRRGEGTEPLKHEHGRWLPRRPQSRADSHPSTAWLTRELPYESTVQT